MKFVVCPMTGLDSHNNPITANSLESAIAKKNPSFEANPSTNTDFSTINNGVWRNLIFWRQVPESLRSMTISDAATQYIDTCNELQSSSAFPPRQGDVWMLRVIGSIDQYLAYQMRE